MKKLIFMLMLALGTSLVMLPTMSLAADYVTVKTCGACGHAVSPDAQVGQTCPYCGVTWYRERRAGFDSRTTGFVSLTVGNFWLSSPFTGFSRSYGSNSGGSISIEAGLGLAKSTLLFGVCKYRRFSKETEFPPASDWEQNFLHLGLRYSAERYIDLPIAPTMGGGLVYSFLTGLELDDASVRGLGYYLEGGLEYPVSNSLSLGAEVEYSSLKLKQSYGDDDSYTLEGGGGVNFGLRMILYFGG
jgi:hypothetical protein